ncbi:hypothetical protein O181_057171 [Austropuccinia psidii MF-1]|uniref:Uncharacterized protein n=1 Tax=Austropuccinia psidii MF-1 TaxID=1389203 RepID=A0A9Q3E7T0_9BASI|nr:hypothetical protein [Austropuccinia psidii MF-1]
MSQALIKKVPKIKEWPHFSGEGEYDHMEFIRGIDIIKEDFELQDRLVTENSRSAHRWYIKLRQAHGQQMKTAFESAKFNADKDKALPWYCQQKDRLTALYPDMSESMINRKILRKWGGDLAHAVKSSTTKKSSGEDIINILEELTSRTRIGSGRVNLKTRFNTPWKDSVDKNNKGDSTDMNYESANVIRKLHICQSTTHLANEFPKMGKINEIEIKKEPDTEKEDLIEDN